MIFNKLTLFVLLLFVFLLPAVAYAQILDDTTKQLYGPTTTRFVLERDILANKERLYTVDTLLDNFHNWNFVNRFDNRYTNLGNLGTALRPVFYAPPAQIGTYLGINIYDKYMLTPSDIKYYDTQSPYSSLYYVQGGLGQQLLKVDFSRNITPNWNAGLEYQRITSPKQFGTSVREDRQIDHHAVALHTRYITQDSTYQILAHFSHLNHSAAELGGIRLGSTETPENMEFDYGEEAAQLRNNSAASRDFRNKFHIYHQYSFARGFQVYHIFDRERQNYDYRDYGLLASATDSSNSGFYPNIFFRPDTTEIAFRYIQYDNQAGLKGSLAGLDYRLYARRRDYTLSYKPAYRQKKKANENFLGGWINYNFSDSAHMQVEAEYLLFRDYRFNVLYENKFWRLGHNRVFYSPTLIAQEMENNHFIWDNEFRNTLSDNTYARFKLNIGQLSFEPFATFSNIKNYIYYDTAVSPKQINTSIQVLSAGLDLSFNWKNLYTVSHFTYSRVSGANVESIPVIQIPQLFANVRLYYQNNLFKSALFMQVGLDMHFQSAYYPYRYMPAIGQYHFQNIFAASEYIVADAFVNVRIKRVRLFFKATHLNQDFTQPGYFVAPYFVGQQRTFAFGVNWLLFD